MKARRQSISPSATCRVCEVCGKDFLCQKPRKKCGMCVRKTVAANKGMTVKEYQNMMAERYNKKMDENLDLYISRWFSRSRQAAKTRNINWDISFDDFVKFVLRNPKCQLSGVPIVYKRHCKSSSASLDRIDSSKGYTLDNIQVVAWRVNEAKNNQTEEEFIEMCKAVVKHNKRKNVKVI